MLCVDDSRLSGVITVSSPVKKQDNNVKEIEDQRTGKHIRQPCVVLGHNGVFCEQISGSNPEWSASPNKHQEDQVERSQVCLNKCFKVCFRVKLGQKSGICS